MRKSAVKWLLSIVLVAASPLSFSASQNECAIWICAPGGFPSGCGAARSAMDKRVAKGESPLPPFHECSKNPAKGSGSHMSAKDGFAALIRETRECTKFQFTGSDNERCMQWKTIPQHFVKGTRCWRNKDEVRPEGCIATYRYIDVFVEGTPAGETYYWR